MPGLSLYSSNKTESLADACAALMRSDPLPPLTAENVVVQSPGMARWLSMHIARRTGVCAHINFPFPNIFIDDLFVQNAVPSPAAAGVLALGGLAATRRRR